MFVNCYYLVVYYYTEREHIILAVSSAKNKDQTDYERNNI